MAQIRVGTGTNGQVMLELSRVNRHGLIAGATGTGKTVTLHALAEQLARAGTPVFISDVKGDLAGIAAAGNASGWVTSAYEKAGLTYTPCANPAVFWDVFGRGGHTARLTIAELGPLLLAKMLELSDVQTGVVQIAFQVADDQGLLLLDLDDLRAVLTYLVENSDAVGAKYGLVSKPSVAAIQRALLGLEQGGAEALFGEPALQVADLLTRSSTGAGYVHVLHAVELVNKPAVYGVFLLYILSELFENLSEVGDLPQPKLALFFDEAHLMFTDAPKALLQKIEQVVRLIRSKGVGVYFITQQPSDVPESVLAQLGNRFQHALRAATPQGQKDIQVAATTMANNPAFKTADVLPKLGVGEALVSVLDKAGVPTPVEIVKVLPPQSLVGPITEATRQSVMADSPLRGRYEHVLDRVSAAEVLAQRRAEAPAPEPKGKAKKETEEAGFGEAVRDAVFGTSRRQGMLETAAKQAIRTAASQAGRALLRGLLGSLTRR